MTLLTLHLVVNWQVFTIIVLMFQNIPTGLTVCRFGKQFNSGVSWRTEDETLAGVTVCVWYNNVYLMMAFYCITVLSVLLYNRPMCIFFYDTIILHSYVRLSVSCKGMIYGQVIALYEKYVTLTQFILLSKVF